MSYLVFCTFDIEGLGQNQSQSRATYSDVYEEMERIGLSREYDPLPRGLGMGSVFAAGQGLMSGLGTTILTGPIDRGQAELPSTSVVGRVVAASPMEAVISVRRDVEAIFRRKGLKGQAFVIAAEDESCDRFVF